MREIIDNSPSRRDPHPVAGEPVWLPRIGDRQSRVIPILKDLGITTIIAAIHYAPKMPQAQLGEEARPMGVALDPCTLLLQQPLAARAPRFRGLSYGSHPTAYSPDISRPSDQRLSELVVEPLDAQRSRGASILMTTYHVAGPVGTRGRAVELLLAEAGVEHFRREAMDEPFDANGPGRQIYATIAIKASDLLSPAARVALADAYLDIPADGYWVKILGLNERASLRLIEACGAFLSLLNMGGRPVVSCGPGQLYLGMLANGVSASIGLAEHEQFAPPTDWRTLKPGKGRKRRAYHAKYQRSFWLDSEEVERAFARAACRCGFHKPKLPPDGRSVLPHVSSIRAAEAKDVAEGEQVARREWVVANAIRASWAGNDADVGFTDRRKFESLFAGFDRDDRSDLRFSENLDGSN